MSAENGDPITSRSEAQRHADLINAYWAKLGRRAGAKVVPVYDHRGRLASYGVSSELSAKTR